MERSPDRVDLEFMLADRIYHQHAVIQLPDGRERAAAHFRRVLELDSAYVPTYQHLVPLLYTIGEREEALRLTRAYLRREPAGAIAGYLEWRMAAAQNDGAALTRIRAGMDTLPVAELLRIFSTAIRDAVEVGDAERAMAILRRRALPPSTELRILREDHIFQLLRGRPDAASRVAARLEEAQSGVDGLARMEARNAQVLSSLYGDGDAVSAAAALEILTGAAFARSDTLRLDEQLRDLCTAAQWRLWNGVTTGIDGDIERLRSAGDRGGLATGPVCAALLEAILATVQGRPDAPIRLARLDSILVTGPYVNLAELLIPGNLAAARLYELQGNPARALAAVRRRVYNMDRANFLLAASLRMEGRLAAQVGDAEGAMHAYRHYLELRSDPEPALLGQADSVRADLGRLIGLGSGGGRKPSED